MKKFRIFYVLFALTALLTFGACTSANTGGSSASAETLEEFYNQPLNKFMVDQMIKASVKSEEGIKSCDISFEGNKMIYEFYMNEHLERDSSVEKIMQNALEAQKDDFFKEIRSTIDIEGAVYEIEYIYYSDDYSKAFDITVSEADAPDPEPVSTSSNEKETAQPETPVTIQSYYESLYGEDYWTETPKILLEQNSQTFNDIRVECKDNTITYIFEFANDMGDVQENVSANMTQDERDSIIFDIKAPTGVTDTITVKYIYYNPDGSVAAEVEFEG